MRQPVKASAFEKALTISVRGLTSGTSATIG